MKKDIIYWHAMSDMAILYIIGGYIKRTRLEQNKTQLQVAGAAGINRSTLVQMEKGSGGTLQTFVRVLRSLEQLQIFENFEERLQISPLKLAKLEQKKRQRAYTSKDKSSEGLKSDW